MTNELTKEAAVIGDDHAARISELTGRDVKFVGMVGDMFEFSVKRYKTYSIRHENGWTTPGYEHDDPFKPNSLPVYFTVILAEVDLACDASTKMMIFNR